MAQDECVESHLTIRKDRAVSLIARLVLFLVSLDSLMTKVKIEVSWLSISELAIDRKHCLCPEFIVSRGFLIYWLISIHTCKNGTVASIFAWGFILGPLCIAKCT